jgi:outer membrane immunogenic protein
MRWVICAAFMIALAPSAFADDLDILRGSQTVGPATFTRWSGFYGGGQFGQSSSSIKFGNSASSDIAFILRNTAIEQDQQISQWTVLNGRTPSSTSWGGFVGYNMQFEDMIIGGELNYNHLSLSATSSDALSRSFVDSTNLPTGHHYQYDVSVAAQAAVHMTDIASFRARAGWVAGSFLPYGFVGFAVGRANVSNSATVAYTATDFPDSETPPLTPLPNLTSGPTTQGNGQNGAFAYGFSAGAGVDVAVTSNIFVRGEFEFIYFAPVEGTQLNIESARVGAGLKF